MFKRKFKAEGLFSQAQQVTNRVQRKTADYLNGKSAQWTSRHIKIMLLLFCLIAGGANLFLIVKGIMPANGPPVLQRTRLSMPKLIPDSISIYKSFKNKQNDNITK